MSVTAPIFEYDVEVVDRVSGRSSHLRIDASSEEDAKRTASQKTGQLIGEARRVGESGLKRAAKKAHDHYHLEWYRDNPPMTKSEIKGRRVLIILAVLFALNGIALLVLGEVSAWRAAEQLRLNRTLAPLLQNRFASDDAIGATANALERLGKDFRDSSALNSLNMRTLAYSLYAACSLVLSMLCTLSASMIKLRGIIRQPLEPPTG